MQKLLSVGLMSVAISSSAAFAQNTIAPKTTDTSTKTSTENTSDKVVVVPSVAGKAVTGQVKRFECNVPFENGKTDVNPEVIKTCVSSLQNMDVKYVSIVGAASPGGRLAKNKTMSEQRAQSVRAEIVKLYPSAQVDARGVGVQSTQGRSAHVVFVTAPTAELAAAEIVKSSTSLASEMPAPALVPEPAPVVVAPKPETPDMNKVNLDTSTKLGSDRTDRENWLRVAVRGAGDRYMEDNKYYSSAGAELSYVRLKTFVPSVRGELGGTGSMMFDENYKNNFRGYNAHAFVGPGIAVHGFVLGARGLGGGVWDKENKFRVDGGGEGRLGYEADNGLSIFAGAGRTQHLTRYGIDMGMVF